MARKLGGEFMGVLISEARWLALSCPMCAWRRPWRRREAQGCTCMDVR